MSIVVFVSNNNGKIAKAGHEAVYYASQLGGEVTAVTAGDVAADEAAALGAFGAAKVLVARNASMADSGQLAKAISAAADQAGADTVVIVLDPTGKEVAARVSVRMQAGMVAGAVALPNADGTITKNVFSGKAKAHVKVNTAKKVIALMPNSLAPEAGAGVAEVADFSPEVGAAAVTVVERKGTGGALSLPEAELVVSAVAYERP